MTQLSKSMPSLAVCILLDFIGYASFSLPILGEFSDLVWAPVSAILFYKLFGGKMGFFGSSFNFFEELLPFTDFIPTFTVAWAIRCYGKKSTQAEMTVSR
jgi:hypothetical protein